IGTRTLLASAHIVAAIGATDARRLVACMGPYYDRNIFNRLGKCVDVHFNQKAYAQWIGRRRGTESEDTGAGLDEGEHLYNMACFEMMWRMETLVWEAGLV